VDLDFFLVSAVVNSSLVLKRHLLVEYEDVRRAYCSVLPGGLLCFVPEVWEVEAFLFGSLDHVRETVLWIVCFVVAVDGDESDSFGLVIVLQLDHAGLVGLGVGAVVAAENNNNPLSREIFQAVGLAINSFEVEVYCRAAKWKSD